MQEADSRYSAPYQATIRDAVAAAADIMVRLIAPLRRELHARESASRDARERALHADALRALHRCEPDLCKGFGLALSEQIARSQDGGKSAPEFAQLAFERLELMGEVQLQQSVNMARMQQVALLASEASLAELAPLVCSTLGLTAVRPERNPLRPEVYLCALRNAVERVAAPHGMRQDWFSTMGQALGPELHTEFERLAANLRAQGVEEADYTVTLAANAPRSPGAGKLRAGAASASPAVVRDGAPASALREASIARERKSMQAAQDPALLTLDRLRKLLVGELEPEPSAGRLAAFGKHFASEFEGASGGGAPAFDVQTDFVATVPAAFEALKEMQQVDRVVQRVAQRINGVPSPDLPHHVQAAREDLRMSAVGVAQALSLEVVSLMVDNIAKDPRLLPPVQALVRELEPPLMRIALADPRFFTHKQHPARLLVQEITHRSFAYAHTQSAGFAHFVRHMQSLIRPLVGAQSLVPEVFADALLALQTLDDGPDQDRLQARNNVVKTLEKVEQRNVLAEKIARDIAANPNVAQVPESVVSFLCGPWAQVVAQARLMGPSGQAVADKYHALVSALLWSTHPELAGQDLGKLTKVVPLLLSTLREGLETIQYPQSETSVFLEALMGMHQSVFRSQRRDAPAHVLQSAQPVRQAPPVPLQAAHTVADGNPWIAPTEAHDSNFVDLPNLDAAGATLPHARPPKAGVEPAAVESQLVLGSWIELATQGQWMRTRLTWSSPHGSLFLFTNAEGATQSMTLRTYDKLLQADQLRHLPTPGVVDDALDAVAQQAMMNSLGMRS
ncbi:MAG: DUF1631 family protein [Rhodoferax sp.]|nr:DUF1631 family protein [Rhodoferax sp.]